MRRYLFLIVPMLVLVACSSAEPVVDTAASSPIDDTSVESMLDDIAVSQDTAETVETAPEVVVEETTEDTVAETTVDTAQDVQLADARVSGHITNLSAGMSVPRGTTVYLHVFDETGDQNMLEAQTAIDGRFIFPDATIQPGNGYMATTMFQGGVFSSDMIRADADTESLDLTLEVYSASDDPTTIRITGVMAQITSVGDSLQVVERIQFVNDADTMYTNLHHGYSLRIDLPPGASVPHMDETSGLVVADDGNTLYDTEPVMPGEPHVVLIAYELPAGVEINRQFVYPFTGTYDLFIDGDALEVTEGDLSYVSDIPDGERTYASYSTTLSSAPSEALTFTVDAAAGSPFSQQNVAMAMMAIGASFLLIGGGMYARTSFFPARQAVSVTDRRAELIKTLAALDEQYEKGTITAKIHQSRRNALKAELAELIQSEGERD